MEMCFRGVATSSLIERKTFETDLSKKNLLVDLMREMVEEEKARIQKEVIETKTIIERTNKDNGDQSYETENIFDVLYGRDDAEMVYIVTPQSDGTDGTTVQSYLCTMFNYKNKQASESSADTSNSLTGKKLSPKEIAKLQKKKDKMAKKERKLIRQTLKENGFDLVDDSEFKSGFVEGLRRRVLSCFVKPKVEL